MASAYAALLSLFNTLNQIKIHPRPPIYLHQFQVESVTQNLTFLKDFLERYPTYEDDDLESRITASAYAAEDVIESNIVHRIHARSYIFFVDLCQCVRIMMDLIKIEVMEMMGVDPIHHAGTTSDDGVDFYEDLERVIQDMDLIKRDVMEIIQQKVMMMTPQDAGLHTTSTASTFQSSTTPVFDDAIINQLLDKLVGQQSSLQIVPIVGMGGIGKTTLAKYIYEKLLIVQYFDTLAWVTISQEYTRRNILQLLCKGVKVSKNVSSEMSEDEIGLVLFQHLYGRRYLIVLDDIWSVEVWYMIQSYFPDDNNGSRIMITTRLSNLASELSDSNIFQMQFLHEHKSWDLLCETVFGKQCKTLFGKKDCPTELEDIGKQIARKCRGLPLSITVIGGLLKKSNMTRAYWIHTLENLNSLVNLENDEYAFRILCASYKELPMHLKPCFLYMGIFPEDKKIRASVLIKLWVAEGIVRPNEDKSLEEVAKEYLKELIDRNLILVAKLRWDGEAKLCGIHDVLRDVCLREAQKKKFICLVRQQKHDSPQDINMERRICISNENANEGFNPEFLHTVKSASLTRSLLYCMRGSWRIDSPSVHLGLLRVYSSVEYSSVIEYNNIITDSKNAIFEHVNVRYLSLKLKLEPEAVSSLRSMFTLLWNLQTLQVSHLYSNRPMMAPSEIWEMPLLKHVMLYNFVLPDPPWWENSWKYLHTLSGINNFKLSEEVVKRISNVKKLKVQYGRDQYNNDKERLFNNNIGRLQKLESLSLLVVDLYNVEIRRNLGSFPHSLKKLSLKGTFLSWEEFTKSVGSLPLLQFLRLGSNACSGAKWETVEGHFCSLRFLHVYECRDLKYWETDSTHFPHLERLYLSCIYFEIPSSIGDMHTNTQVNSVGRL